MKQRQIQKEILDYYDGERRSQAPNVEAWNKFVEVCSKSFSKYKVRDFSNSLFPCFSLDINIGNENFSNSIRIQRSIRVKQSFVNSCWFVFGTFSVSEYDDLTKKYLHHNASIILSEMGVYANFLQVVKEEIMKIDKNAVFIPNGFAIKEVPAGFTSLPFFTTKLIYYNYLFDSLDISSFHVMQTPKDRIESQKILKTDHYWDGK